ncbi:unnamed protein product [Spirodela intermedia]|uniref:Methyltransferase type 11 domain-containing protein n=1 Tax=Spirodela intermedia TaxID=51605 RepID=A0ABN7EB60_SPIIN|nr:unnamed protein product [Spirodela intermedia]
MGIFSLGCCFAEFLVLVLRFAYVITVYGEHCDYENFCFFPSNGRITFAGVGVFVCGMEGSASTVWFGKEWRKALPCAWTRGQEVFGVEGDLGARFCGISENKCSPLVTSGDIFDQPFGNNTFDFIFSCCDTVELPKWPASLALEISWIMKSEGFESVLYSLHSFWAVSLALSWLGAANIDGFDPSAKEDGSLVAISTNKFSILEHKLKLLYSAEPQIKEDPLKPWITLKRNMEKSYRSSVGSWFEKQYPKKSKIFEVYAIETDRTYHSEYGSKKGVSLLPMLPGFVVMKLDMKGTGIDLIPIFLECHYNRWQKCCPQGRTPNTTIHMSSSCKFSLCSGCVEFMFISGGGCTITFIS